MNSFFPFFFMVEKNTIKSYSSAANGLDSSCKYKINAKIVNFVYCINKGNSCTHVFGNT